MVVALTSNVERAHLPGNVLLEEGVGGLVVDSVVNVTQVITIDRMLWKQRIGAVPATTVEEIDRGLARVMGLRG